MSLNIPAQAAVFCRHGGLTTFNIPFVHDTIFKLLELYDRDKLQFLFLGTENFMHKKSSQVRFLPTTASFATKEKFFNTCNAMIHARMDGETFGNAVAEFSIRNKPVITYKSTNQKTLNMGNQRHIQILGDKGFYYHDHSSLMSIISDFISKGIPKRDYNAYAEFSPVHIIPKFKKILLDPILTNNESAFFRLNRC